MPEKDLFHRLTLKYYYLTKSEKRVADFIIANKHNAQYMSITELAEACGVADSTITRFCSKIQCNGFNGFKIELVSSSANRHILSDQNELYAKDDIRNFFEEVKNMHIETINESLSLVEPDEITKSVELLSNAGTVLCVGQGASMIMAQEAAHLFSTVRGNVVAMLDSHIQTTVASNLNPNDIVLFFSYSGSTRELLEMIELNKSNNVKTILITRYPQSVGAIQADIVLQCGSVQSPHHMGSVAAKIAQLFILDLLFLEYNRRNPENCKKFKDKILHALAKKHL